MKLLAQIISFVALGATVLAPMLFFYDNLSLPQTQVWLLLSAGVWFLATPFWMEHKA